MSKTNQLINPSENPVQQPTSHPINNQRGIFPIGLGIVVLLILVGGGAYYLGIQKSQTPQQSATPVTQTTSVQPSESEWKTYKDKNNTFTMRYPSNFFETLETHKGDDLNTDINAGALSTIKPYNSSLDKESDMLIEMVIRALPQNMTLDDYIQTKILTRPREDTDGDGIVGPPFKIVPDKRKTINIDGKEATWLEGIAFMSVTHTEVFIPYKNDQIVVINILEGTVTGMRENRNQEQYQKNIKLAEEIVSTFQFTKKAVIKSLPIDSQNAEGVFMENGKVSFGEGHNFGEMRTEDSVTLSNGTIVKGNGEITEIDGTKFMLKEGQAYYFER